MRYTYTFIVITVGWMACGCASVTPRSNWEYRTMYNLSLPADDALNRLGANGWEVTSVIRGESHDRGTVILRRRVK